MENEAVPVLPCASVALQVTLVVPSGNIEPEGGLQVTSAIGPSRLSVAVRVGKFVTEPPGPFASRVLLDGTPVRTGAVWSTRTTVTVKLPEAVLPCPSFAEQFTVVVPIANELPDAGLQDGASDPPTSSATRFA